jgi:hypothetical protein
MRRRTRGIREICEKKLRGSSDVIKVSLAQNETRNIIIVKSISNKNTELLNSTVVLSCMVDNEKGGCW